MVSRPITTLEWASESLVMLYKTNFLSVWYTILNLLKYR